MPHLITNMGSRQTHPLYKTKPSKEPGPMGKKGPDKGPEKRNTSRRPTTPSRQLLERTRSREYESENYFLRHVYTYMVEAMANGVEDKLIDGLSFKLQPGSSYVVDRRSVTYHPQGSNIYTPGAGTRLIRILLTGED